MPSLAAQALIAACLSLAAVAYASEPAVPAPTSAAPTWLKVHGNGLHSSGQPSAEQLQALPAHGIGVVIDLRRDGETPDLDEASVVRALGVDYHNLPVAGPDGLTRANVERLDALIAEANGRPVLVHCASGNRVGAMMALREAWLRGASPEEAMAVGRQWGLTGLAPTVEALLSPVPAEAGAASTGTTTTTAPGSP